MYYRTIFTFLVISQCMACQVEESKEQPPAEPGDESNYLIPGLDHGLLQSPINILSDEASDGKHSVTVNFTGIIEDVQNLGHTVQLDFEPGNTITMDGRTYEFKQIHFHTPSEHLIDGITYPMEIHVVNTLLDQLEDSQPEYLVLALLLKMGEENELIQQFIGEIPEEDTMKQIDLNLLKQAGFFQLDSLEGAADACYHYMGSLTTPPYTESVSWFIMKRIYEASPEQISTMNEIEGDNARHIQSRNRREVTD